MNRNVLGMDTDTARQTAGQMDSHAQAVGGLVGRISSTLAGLKWDGPDRVSFQRDWDTHVTGQSTQTQQEMQEQAQVLRVHADRQDAVSA